MKFLIIGGLGYIGQVLQKELKKRKHEFKIVDNDLMNLHNWENKLDITNYKDLQEIGDLIESSDVVVNLAAVVGDQACLVDTKLSIKINCDGVRNVVGMCNSFNKKIIHLSTCSLYGKSSELLTEESKLFPVDFYGQTKYQQERYVLENSENYCVFRLGTAYGHSSRMRFDLVVNSFAAKRFLKKKLEVFGGEQWRPFVHIKDISRAIIFSAEKNLKGVYNLSNQNITITDLAKSISVGNGGVEINNLQADPRDYKVDNSKIIEEGFVFEWKINHGVDEIMGYEKEMKDFENPKYSNYKLMMLINNK